MRSRAVFIPVALFLIVALAAPACSRGGGADAEVPFIAVDPDSDSPTDRAIAKAQQQLEDDPEDPNAQLDLAMAFLQKARETADPTLYTKAGTLLDLVAEDSPDDPGVLLGQSTLALAQHRFTDALELGRRTLEVAPGTGSAYGVIVDACNELGRYDEALEAGQQMLDIRPDLPALTRASYARELRGDLEGAIVAMTQAVTAGSGAGGGENLAYSYVLLGDLLVTTGDLDQAADAYTSAETAFPEFPAAKAGRARILVAQGRNQAAADLLAEVLDVQPLSQYAIARGDALVAAGQSEEAEKAYALVDVIASLEQDNGVSLDLELAVFKADHDPGPEAVEQARTARKARPSIFGHDALAWNLMRAGDAPAASEVMADALATGSRDPAIRFHAAVIADANGDRSSATEHLRSVLDTNPRFSASHADEVETLARNLGLSVPPPDPNPPGR